VGGRVVIAESSQVSLDYNIITVEGSAPAEGLEVSERSGDGEAAANGTARPRPRVVAARRCGIDLAPGWQRRNQVGLMTRTDQPNVRESNPLSPLYVVNQGGLESYCD
jgi:hypothetical protein